MDLLGEFKAFIKRENLFQSHDRLLLAVSGGVDSVVLCDLCKRAGFNFVIAHCNFQLRGEDSDRDESFVRSLAQKYQVPCLVKVFDTMAYTRESGKSIEEAARDLRYEWFYSLLDTETARQMLPGENEGGNSSLKYVLTAHHADDNIETVMMNFFRGTGISGIRGMLPIQGKIIRPLLFIRRNELELFVKENNLDFVTDHTNQENDYTRNFFRNTIIPLIRQTYPAAEKNVLNNIQRFRETELLYQQSVQMHRKKLVEIKGAEVHIPVLKLLKTVPLATILYEIIKVFGFTAHQTGEVVGLLNRDTGKYLQSATHRVIKNRNWLIISPKKSAETRHILLESKESTLDFYNGTITLAPIRSTQYSQTNDPLIAQLDLAEITFPLLLRKWKQGDYFYPLGMQKKKKLSRFFIDQKLSLTQKENAWVIEMNKKIIWVVGMRIDDRFKIRDSTKEILRMRYLPK